MATFDRRLPHLNKLSLQQAPPWWRDLLALWRPSGQEAGDYGLRLAIRAGYVNFYHQGQSVARVEFDSRGRPAASIHNKYVRNVEGAGQKYLKLDHEGRLQGQPAYESMETLKNWIDRSLPYSGEEKKHVDKLVAANANIIDLEIGLPAGGGIAPRMDIVAIESAAGRPTVVFWEAKLDSDSRIKTRSEFLPNEYPHILKQLDSYRVFLGKDRLPNGPQAVARAYKEAASILVKLRDLAAESGNRVELGSDIVKAAQPGVALDVDPEPRLVVIDKSHLNPRSAAAWAEHAKRLKDARISMQVVKTGGSYLLGRPD